MDIVGFYAKLWWLDALGGLLLSLFVIFKWAGVSTEHIRNLTGAAATADQRNVLLYLTMRFAKTIKQIQGLQAYHAGDKLNVEVDIVLDENMNLRDSHDLGESLQYVLESVPTVDRAFVHIDVSSQPIFGSFIVLTRYLVRQLQFTNAYATAVRVKNTGLYLLWFRSQGVALGYSLLASTKVFLHVLVIVRDTNHCASCTIIIPDALDSKVPSQTKRDVEKPQNIPM